MHRIVSDGTSVPELKVPAELLDQLVKSLSESKPVDQDNHRSGTTSKTGVTDYGPVRILAAPRAG